MISRSVLVGFSGICWSCCPEDRPRIVCWSSVDLLYLSLVSGDHWQNGSACSSSGRHRIENQSCVAFGCVRSVFRSVCVRLFVRSLASHSIAAETARAFRIKPASSPPFCHLWRRSPVWLVNRPCPALIDLSRTFCGSLADKTAYTPVRPVHPENGQVRFRAFRVVPRHHWRAYLFPQLEINTSENTGIVTILGIYPDCGRNCVDICAAESVLIHVEHILNSRHQLKPET